MSKAHIPEEIRKKASAGAEAIYRLTGADGFDLALKLELRKAALETLAAIQKFEFSIDVGEPRERILVLAASIREALLFGVRMGYIAEKNSERVASCFGEIGDAACGIAADIAVSDEKAEAGSEPKISAKQRGKEEEEEDPHSPSTGEAPPVSFGEVRLTLNDRQKKIMSFLSRGAAQIGDIRNHVGSETSEKTVQRDLWQLINFGLIRKEGDYRWTVYCLSPERARRANSE